MIGDLSLSLIAQAAAPGIGLVAIGLTWLHWGKLIGAIPATLFSIGIALLALMVLVVLIYSTSLKYASNETIILILGITPFIYVASLILCQRRASLSATAVTVLGFLGLVPLWFLGGFVLMSSVCSFGTGGC